MRKKTETIEPDIEDQEDSQPLVVPGAATEEELLLFLSGVMRGQLAEAGGREISMGDRLKASTGLMKLFEDRREEAAAGDRELALAHAAARIGSSIAPAFAGVFGDVLVHGHTHYDLAAGYGQRNEPIIRVYLDGKQLSDAVTRYQRSAQRMYGG